MPYARYVLPRKFEELTGYTVKAQEKKIETGVWQEGKEYRKTGNRIHIDMEGYTRWVEQTKAAA